MSYRAAPPREELLRTLAAEAAEAERGAQAAALMAQQRVELLEREVEFARHLVGGAAERLRELQARAKTGGAVDSAVLEQVEAARAAGQAQLATSEKALGAARRKLADARRAATTAERARQRAERDLAELKPPRA